MDKLFATDNLPEAIKELFFMNRLKFGIELIINEDSEPDLTHTQIFGIANIEDKFIVDHYAMFDSFSLMDGLKFGITSILLTGSADYVFHVYSRKQTLCSILYSGNGPEKVFGASFDQCKALAISKMDFSETTIKPIDIDRMKSSEANTGMWQMDDIKTSKAVKAFSRQFQSAMHKGRMAFKEATSDVVWN